MNIATNCPTSQLAENRNCPFQPRMQRNVEGLNLIGAGRLCNKGTALAGPQIAQKALGL